MSWTPCDVLQGQILRKFHVARVKKCQRTREDVSLQHVPETRPDNFFTSVPTLRFGPCYMTPLHSPETCPISVHLTRFCPRYILQQNVLQHVPSCGTKDNKNENHCLSKCLGLPVWLLAAALLITINHSTDSLDYYLFVLDGLDMSLLY